MDHGTLLVRVACARVRARARARACVCVCEKKRKNKKVANPQTRGMYPGTCGRDTGGQSPPSSRFHGER